MNLNLQENILNAKQFLELRESVGWVGVEHQLDLALKNGLHNVVAKDGDKIVGMARLIGDGVMYWHVQDVIVIPSHQGKGVGKLIMEHVLNHISKSSLPNTTIIVGLMSAKGKEPFYEGFGFLSRPNGESGAGMVMRYEVK